jgi:hypothetical protein
LLQLGGAGVVSALVAPLLVRAGAAGLQRMLAYSSAGAVGGSGKLSQVVLVSWLSMPRWVWLAMLGGVPLLSLVSRRWPRVALPAILVTPLLAACSLYEGVLRSLAFAIYAGALALPLMLGPRDRGLAGRVLLGLWFPSLIAGLCTAWTSSNGTIAAGLGLWPAALTGGFLLARWSSETAERTGLEALQHIAQLAPVSLLSCLLSYALDNASVYRDLPIDQLPARIPHGPYRGLWTTGQKAQYLDDLEKVLLPQRSSARLGCYYDFPACYLMADMRPSFASTWTATNPARNEFDLASLQANHARGNLVVKILNGWANSEATPIDTAVRARYKLQVQRINFALYRVE